MLMETAIGGGDDGFDLSPDELALCRRIVAGREPVPVDHPLLPRLLRLGVVIDDQYHPGFLVLSKPEIVEARLREELEGDALAVLERMRAVPNLSHALRQLHRNIDPGNGISVHETFTPTVRGAADMISREINGASDTLWSAQPGHRRPDVITRSRRRDVPLLVERGFDWRTIYDISQRGNAPLAEYVAEMTARGARIRTLPERFSRLILMDGQHVFFEDRGLIQTPERGGTVAEPREGAWHCQGPGVVGFLHTHFEQMWARATPWYGTEVDPPQTITNALQRSILWELEKGKDQTQVAAHFQTSRKRVQRALTDLREALGFKTLWQLGPWWAHSEERAIDHNPGPEPGPR
jgi:hypothetical protein